MFSVKILTLFPEMFPGPLQYSLAGQALLKNIWGYETVNIRNFGLTKHKNVDDYSYGGGDGLIMRPDVLGNALDYALIKNRGAKIYYPSPRGVRFSQPMAHEISKENNIIILCGRFEGIDERVIDEYNVTEISIGDYILSGGEIAALAILDCVIRLLPGVVDNKASLNSESLEEQGKFLGMLEYPLYTRPANWRGREVPDILLSGNHAMIRKWQLEQSIEVTKARRPDLYKPDLLKGKVNK